jgi:hypothetical protein
VVLLLVFAFDFAAVFFAAAFLVATLFTSFRGSSPRDLQPSFLPPGSPFLQLRHLGYSDTILLYGPQLLFFQPEIVTHLV